MWECARRWMPSSELVVLSPTMIQHLSHSAYIEEQLTNSDAYERLM